MPSHTINVSAVSKGVSMKLSAGQYLPGPNLGSWCVRPGNYSMTLWDYSLVGWQGGGVFLTVGRCRLTL